MRIRKQTERLTLAFVLLAFGCTAHFSQVSTEELERRKLAAQARTAEAQARAAEAQARTAEANSRRSEIQNRKAELDLLAANTTVSGELIENEISAYKAVACAAAEINQQVRTASTQIDLLMIYSPRFAKTMAEYSVMISQLERLRERYESLYRPPVAIKTVTENDKTKPGSLLGDLSVAKQFSALAIDTLALFKTEVDIQGKTVVIGKDEFIAKLLRGINLEVYYPEKIIPMNINDSRLLNLLSDLAEDRVKAEYILKDKYEIDPYWRKQIVPNLQALNSSYDNLITQFFPSQKSAKPGGNKTVDGSKDPVYKVGRRSIIDFMRAEVANQIMSKQDEKRKYWLDVHVTRAASNQRNKSSAVVDIFTGGKRLSFSGGSIVNYRIFNSNGRVISSDTILSYMPYKRSKKIAEYRCQRVTDIP